MALVNEGCRATECEFDCVGSRDGSLWVTHGDSSCICVLSGPVEAPSRLCRPTECAVKVAVAGPQDKRSEYAHLALKVEAALRGAIRTGDYPRLLIELKVYPAAASEDIFACVVNGASMLLLAAGVALRGVLLGLVSLVESEAGLAVWNKAYVQRGGKIEEVHASERISAAEDLAAFVQARPAHSLSPPTEPERLADLSERLKFAAKTYAYRIIPEDEEQAVPGAQ